MPINVLMPQLSPTMTEGNLAKWHKNEGDKVAAGDILAEIETDKATMEVEAVDEGTLGRIVVPAGSEGVKVNTVIAVILGEGEAAGTAAAPAAAAPPPPAAAPAAAKVVAPPPPPVAAPPAATVPAAGDRAIASPLARRMAERAGLTLGALAGSGPGGRIVKSDVEAALAKGAAAPAVPTAAPAAKAAPPAAPVVATPGAGWTDVPLSLMRKTIARRLQESKQTIPHFYLTIDCAIDGLLKLRKDLNARSDTYKLTVNDFVVRALGLALRKVPEANAAWAETAIRRFATVDVAVAVAIDGGLITPVVRDADRKGLAAISNEVKDLAARAKAGKLAPEEYQGGGFSVSNLGMYGIRQFEAIINPPQAGILAIGAGEARPVVKDGALAIATVMTCTLSCDHRVIDGALGAELLGAFKGLIEDPLTMLL